MVVDHRAGRYLRATVLVTHSGGPEEGELVASLARRQSLVEQTKCLLEFEGVSNGVVQRRSQREVER